MAEPVWTLARRFSPWLRIILRYADFVAFLWSTQYIFFNNIPDDISSFAFLTLTNAIGFLITLAVLPKTVFKFTGRQIWHSFVLGIILFVFNITLIIGSRMVDYTSAAFFASAYIIFVPIVLLAQGKAVTRRNVYAVILTLIGVFLGTGAAFSGFGQTGVLYILFADFLFAVYMVLIEKIAKYDNVLVVSMGQMFFVSLFSFVAWLIVQPSSIVNIPTNIYFWIDVLAIALFIRSYSTIMQIYAQRYVTAVNASLVFSTEIIFTVIASTFLPSLVGGVPQKITALKLCGCVLIVLGGIVSEGVFGGRSDVC